MRGKKTTGNKISMTQSRAVWRLGWPGTHPRLTLLPAGERRSCPRGSQSRWSKINGLEAHRQAKIGQTQEMTDLGIDLDAEVWKQGMVSSQVGSPVLWHRYQRLEDRTPRVSRVRDYAVFLYVYMYTCMNTQTHCETLENRTASYSLYIPVPTTVPGNSKCSLSAFEMENVE